MDLNEIANNVANEIANNIANEIANNVANEIANNVANEIGEANEMGEANAMGQMGQTDQKSILDFLVNPLYQNNIKRQQKAVNKDNGADIKFYRKRIISLCKDMLKGQFESGELKQIHENYVNELIFYFKMKDTCDILQAQYDSKKEMIPSIDASKEAQMKEAQPKEAQMKEAQPKEAQPKEAQMKEAQMKEVQMKEAQPEAQPKEITNNTELNINKNLMRKKNTSTLDNYVTVVKKEKEQSYPVKKEINLKTSSLKNKGVRPKNTESKTTESKK